MDKFVERYNIPRLNQEEIENMNRPVTSTETENVILKLSTHKSPGTDAFTGEFYQIFREELTLSLLKLFQKISEDGTLPNTFHRAAISLITKPDKDTTKKKKKRTLQANITDEHRCKNPQQILANQIHQYIKRNIHHDQAGFISGMQEFFSIQINPCDISH